MKFHNFIDCINHTHYAYQPISLTKTLQHQNPSKSKLGFQNKQRSKYLAEEKKKVKIQRNKYISGTEQFN